MRLLERITESGRHLAFMTHFNHWRELEPPVVAQAIARLRSAGAVVRTQSPLVRHINDDAQVWARMWQRQVQLRLYPLLHVRGTRYRHAALFKVPLAQAIDIYRIAMQQVSGLARTARGPVMSSLPGKIVLDGVTEVGGERVFALSFLQGREASWCKRPFFAKYDRTACWLHDLRPAFGESEFFYENELRQLLTPPCSQSRPLFPRRPPRRSNCYTSRLPQPLDVPPDDYSGHPIMIKTSSTPKPDHRLLVAALIAVPLLIVLAKWPGLPTAEFLRTHFTLETLPLRVQHKLTHILFVPLGAMLIVLVRLTLGLRLLGPFRSLLLAVAFQATGIALGVTFLTVTIGIVAFARPSIRALRMPYFGRTTVLLSSVAGLMVLVVLAGSWLHIGLLNSIAYFPIVVLSLIADAFARTAKSEGWPSALWRAGVTASVAIVLTAIANVPARGRAVDPLSRTHGRPYRRHHFHLPQYELAGPGPLEPTRAGGSRRQRRRRERFLAPDGKAA